MGPVTLQLGPGLPCLPPSRPPCVCSSARLHQAASCASAAALPLASVPCPPPDRASACIWKCRFSPKPSSSSSPHPSRVLSLLSAPSLHLSAGVRVGPTPVAWWGGPRVIAVPPGQKLPDFPVPWPGAYAGSAHSGLKTCKRNTKYSHTAGFYAAIKGNGAGNMLHVRPSERSPYCEIPLIPIETGSEWC